MYQRILLDNGAVQGNPGPLPPDLVGLADESLADLSAALDPCPAHLVGIGYWPVTMVNADAPTDPAVDADERRVVVTVVPPPPPVPDAVSAFQARSALRRAGLLGQVEAAIEASTDPDAKLAWEYATQFVRNGGLINSIGTGLGLTDAQIDDLFRLAEGIEA